MSTIDIFYSTRPKRGKYISEGKYGFGIVDGAPAMRCRWRGGLLRSEEVFHFQTQTEAFVSLDMKSIEGMARWGRKGAPDSLGVLGMLPFAAITAAVTAWQAATTKIKGTQAFAISYRNPQGHFSILLALGPTDFVAQIAACLPPDKIKDTKKTEEA
jgi:hypothetical protein